MFQVRQPLTALIAALALSVAFISAGVDLAAAETPPSPPGTDALPRNEMGNWWFESRTFAVAWSLKSRNLNFTLY